MRILPLVQMPILHQVLTLLSGYSTFGATLALSTRLQKVAGISTTTRILPRVLGTLSVCGASVGGQRVAMLSDELQRKPEKRNFQYSWQFLTASPDYRNSWTLGPFHIPRQETTACLVGLSVFTALGGKMCSISPSSFSGAGSFARKRLPAGFKYANDSQKIEINRIGEKYGCHTCGTKVSPKFYADHVPPRSVGKRLNLKQYHFHPHCEACCAQQAKILGKASGKILKETSSRSLAASFIHRAGGINAHVHGLRFRICHLTGGVVVGTSLHLLPGTLHHRFNLFSQTG